MRSDEIIYWFWDSSTPYSFDNRDKKAFIEQYNTRKKQIDVQIDAFSHHRTPKNVTAVRNQYPKDYVTLRSAWIERVLMDPITYIKFKTRFFRKFCKDNTLNFLGINALLLSPMLIGIVVCWTLSKKMTRPEIFPCLMLTWSAIFYILPLWAFLPDDRCIRYLYWFFAASFIAIVYFCSQSKLFNELVQTIQRYLEEKVNEGKINKEK
ncbi:MAG: hypothetical protein LBT89_12210 [Planctomycetaceae bacterium]|jgi:hypothetical protein|nr:hypothetical protein [Planctomycetaceae bacterium]